MLSNGLFVFTIKKDYVCTVTFRHRIWTSAIRKLFSGYQLTYLPTRTRKRCTEEAKIQQKQKRLETKLKNKEDIVTKRLCRLIQQLL